MPSDLLSNFIESGRMEQTRKYINSQQCKPNTRRLLAELIAIIDSQHHIIMNDDELSQEYKELFRG